MAKRKPIDFKGNVKKCSSPWCNCTALPEKEECPHCNSIATNEGILLLPNWDAGIIINLNNE